MLLEKLDGVTPQLLDTTTVPELHMDDTTTNTGNGVFVLKRIETATGTGNNGLYDSMWKLSH